jgi:hypothetical protein
VLIKLTPKDNVTNLTFPAEIIMSIMDENKQALKYHWVRKLPLLQQTSPWGK